jgi:hypothetical protein
MTIGIFYFGMGIVKLGWTVRIGRRRRKGRRRIWIITVFPGRRFRYGSTVLV